MSNPSVIQLQLPAADTNGIAMSQSAVAAVPLTLNGDLVAGGVADLVVAQRVVIHSGGDDSGITWTIVGTTRWGSPQSEVLAGKNASDAVSALDYLTVTSITSSGASASTVYAGTDEIGSSEWVEDNFLAPSWYLSVAVALISGSGNFTVEHTYDDPNQIAQQGITPPPQNFSMVPASSVPPVVWSLTALTSKTASTESTYAAQPIFAHRLKVNSGTGSFKMWSTQGGIGSP